MAGTMASTAFTLHNGRSFALVPRISPLSAAVPMKVESRVSTHFNFVTCFCDLWVCCFFAVSDFPVPWMLTTLKMTMRPRKHRLLWLWGHVFRLTLTWKETSHSYPEVSCDWSRDLQKNGETGRELTCYDISRYIKIWVQRVVHPLGPFNNHIYQFLSDKESFGQQLCILKEP